jgi:hypothetical protein
MKKILKPTKVKIIGNIFFSLIMVLLAIFLPSSGVSDAFVQLPLGRQLLSFFISCIVSFIFYYPLTASLAHLASSIKNSTYVLKEIIWVVVFIIIFNPLTLSVVITKLYSVYATPKTDQSSQITEKEVQSDNQPTCGLIIGDFIAGSKAEEAGLKRGENILLLNGMRISSVQDIFDQLENKKPGDRVTLETDQGLKTVELVSNISDPNRSALGVKLISNPCK